jgi:hypothetical protein
MSLYPGDARVNPVVGGPPYILDDVAVQESMAKAMEDALSDLHQRLKGVSLPDMAKEERRLLFVAISRGILKYLSDHQIVMRASVNVTGSGVRTVHNFNMHVTLDHHDPDV